MKVEKKQLGLYSLFLMALLFVGTNNFALAQVQASISGRIVDPSGAAVPGATVRVTNLETGATRAVSSDATGYYRALSLPVGGYEVRAEMAGFRAMVQTGITLVVGQEAVVNLRLEVGAVEQEVTVTADAPLVNTTTASVSGLVGEQQIKDLPLNGRSFDLLITLNPGATNYTAMQSTGSTGSGKRFSVAGRRPSENLFLLNGVELTSASLVAMTPGGVSGQLLGIDAVREFNVVSGASTSAEYGKRPGGQVSVVTQSGTNRLRGSLFEYLRNDKLDARNFFDRKTVPPFKRNQFGGSLGGPVRRDKTFLFGAFEGFRQRLGLSYVAIVPDLNARRGLLPDAQGVPTPVQGLEPRMLNYMILWAEPNGPELGDGTALFFHSPSQSIRNDFGNMRFDHNFSSKDFFSAVYTVDDGESLTPEIAGTYGSSLLLRNQVFSLHETHVFSPSVLNDFTAGVSRAGCLSRSTPLISIPSDLAFVTGLPVGGIVVAGGTVASQPSVITSTGSSINPFAPVKRTLFTFSDGVKVIQGNHQVSAGVSFQRIRSNQSIVTRRWGNASFPSLRGFLQGTVNVFGVAPNAVPMAWRSLQGAWYLQDAIELRPNLSLRLGVRHEFTDGWNDGNGRASHYLFDPNGVIITEPEVGRSLFTENNARRLLGPRVGLAWDPFGMGKTSIRAGFATHYNLFDSVTFSQDSMPPFNGTATFSNFRLTELIPVSPGIPLPPACNPGVPRPCTTYAPVGLQPSFKTPTVHSWNFTVEQQLTQDIVLRVAYVGSKGYHDFIAKDPNAIRPQICASPEGCTSGGVGSVTGAVPQGAEYIPVGTRPNPFMSDGQMLFSEGNNNYNSLQLDLTRRFRQGLQFRVNYTWSKNLDIGSGIASSQARNESSSILNPYDLGRDWGPASLNVTHQSSQSFSYELPVGRGKPWLSGAGGLAEKLAGGWQVNGIVTLQSGFPFTPLIGSNRSGNGDIRNQDRPSVNPAFTGPVIIGSPNQWFNPNAYVFPTPGTFGNVGRSVLTGPVMAVVDFSVFKDTRISEQVGLEFRAEVFNIINRANFGLPNPIVFSAGRVSPVAGLITETTTSSRQMQFGLRLTF